MKDKILHISKRILRHELISGSFFIFFGSILSGFLTFLLNLFFARSLTTVDYGIYASLLSLITLAVIPAQSIQTVVVKFATDYLHKERRDLAAIFYKKTFKTLLVIAALIFILLLTFSVPIKSFLRIDSSTYLILANLSICFTYLCIANSAYAQSLLKFSFTSFVLIVSAAVRLIGGVILVLIGFKLFGALVAFLFSTLATFFLGFIPVGFLFKKGNTNKENIKLREIIKYALPVCLSILALTSFTTMDVILVKHFFSPSQAGFYGGLSLIGKVIFYFTGSISTVMFPLAIKRKAKGENIASLFYLAILLVTIPSVLITCFYYIFPTFTIIFFLGKNYLNIIPYLGFFGTYITIFSMLNVSMNFLLSIGKTRVYIPVIIAAICQIILICVFHKSFFQVIGVSLGVSTLLLAYLLTVFAKMHINFKDMKDSLFAASTSSL